MKTIYIIILAFLCAGWTVSRERDPMSDKTFTWASVRSGDATLLFGCLNGRTEPRLTWTSPKGFGRGIEASWRVDNGPVTALLAGMFSQDGRTLYPFGAAAPSLAGAKRLRIKIGNGDFYDFDLTAGEPLPSIKCGSTS